jgi:glycosyltransferase involved in cell wall biosynthesis
MIHGIINHYLYIIFAIPYNNYKIAHGMNKSKVLLAYQSWVTKSPIIIRKSIVPVIYICHETPREFYDEEYIKTFSIKEKIVNYIGTIIKKIDMRNIADKNNIRIIANSKLSATQIEKVYGIKPDVIYPGISLKMFGKNTKRTARKNQVISVGSINKLKNQKFLIECLSKIDSKNRPSLILVGNGGNIDYINDIKKYASNKLVKTKIYQNISDITLVRLYKQSKIFLYSSLNEPFGIVILEALAAGLPIISTKTGGFSEVISKNNGNLHNDFNPSLWANSINTILKQPILWEKYSSNNYKLSKNYSDSIMNIKLANIIRSISVQKQ